MNGKIVQTAGRKNLGEFAPAFAHFNDDVLFGENWNNQDIDLKTRCIITVAALVSSGVTDSSLTYHLQNAKAHGVTKKEIAAILTHVAFYAGWPKAWAHSIRRRKSGKKKLLQKQRRWRNIRHPCSFRSVSRMMLMPVISQAKVFWLLFPLRRSASTMLPLRQAARITGISTMQKAAVVRF